ncbi:MAG TPA: 2-phospho-L-lactate transferase [Polyangiaceae bacterium]
MKLVALAGGTGAAKFLRGLCCVVRPSDLTIIGNTGDDLDLWGLYISPDLDTVSYTLAGLVDEGKGWGRTDDTFQCRAQMAMLGNETFFALGDKDLAIHLFRTEQLRSGMRLSRVTDELRRRMRLESELVPMSDDRVATRVETPQGALAFQEFFVRERCEPEVIDVSYEGADRARPAPGVIEAIRAADVIILCPSNPISSLGPILAIPGLRRALVETRARVTAVSPVIGSAAVSGPAGKMMRAKGLEISALGVADCYADLLDQLVIDRRDAALTGPLFERGIRAVESDGMMVGRDEEIALARATLEAAL